MPLGRARLALRLQTEASTVSVMWRGQLLPFLLWALFPRSALASDGGSHADPVAPLALALVIVLVVAKLGGEVAVRLKQPAVVGELLAGVIVGNLSLVGLSGLDHLWTDPTLDMLARLGVLVLLFEVGLESTVGQMLRVGGPSLMVATLGVAAPFGLEWATSAWLMPGQSEYVHAFVGATLCATSVGITARVFQDLGRLQTTEARIILGAAVIDDVMGLVVLAVVSGIIASAGSGTGFSYGAIGLIVFKALAFLVGALVLGRLLSAKVFEVSARLRSRGVLLALGMAWCLSLSWLSNLIGLAPIVGAFAAGLILEDVHYRGFVDKGEHSLEELIQPISAFLAPVFFVLMGMRTDLRAFAASGVLGLALALTAAAVVGKQLCSLGVWGRGIDRLTVGIGMIPRGEVGLIFANIGLGLVVDGQPVVDRNTFSALVVMVILTTLITPFALKVSLSRKRVQGAGVEAQ
jgi:Kef-type K+ transport system membrane component KefB